MNNVLKFDRDFRRQSEDSLLPEISRLCSKLSEDDLRWKAAIKYAPIAIVIVSLDGKLVELNPAALDLFERDEEELRSLRWQDVTYPPDVAPDTAHVADMIAGKIKTYTYAKRYIMPDGGLKKCLLKVAAVTYDTGEPRYFISMITDLEWMQVVVDTANREFMERDRGAK